jgi:hypothetical protein
MDSLDVEVSSELETLRKVGKEVFLWFHSLKFNY